MYAIKKFTVPTDWMFSAPNSQTGQTDLFQAFRKELRMIRFAIQQAVIFCEIKLTTPYFIVE